MNKNIIIDGRIVSDKTFALRLKKFLESTQVFDLSSEEEKSYLLGVAKDLLHHQVVTLKDASEKQYLMRNGVIRPKRTIEDFKKALSKTSNNGEILHVTNKKTGDDYIVLGLITNTTNSVDGQSMVAYYRNGSRYCREISEFIDKFDW